MDFAAEHLFLIFWCFYFLELKKINIVSMHVVAPFLITKQIIKINKNYKFLGIGQFRNSLWQKTIFADHWNQVVSKKGVRGATWHSLLSKYILSFPWWVVHIRTADDYQEHGVCKQHTAFRFLITGEALHLLQCHVEPSARGMVSAEGEDKHWTIRRAS